MDTDPIAQHSHRERVVELGIERMLPGRIG
jgi:hypothetical protein